ncbi:hypothetical protein pv_267 [Pithovirus sibericum]|uniref:Uncharacterized protein n=1 Tax=Pithovirus sibericum TaxID=1450746 RepID=W5S593_9VIRU|nr:hypothetical protein pv_267 [Pithovirus sibericum]AHH01834.1 hypothetical protein pv_267 [Pithovirus sibericum]
MKSISNKKIVEVSTKSVRLYLFRSLSDIISENDLSELLKSKDAVLFIRYETLDEALSVTKLPICIPNSDPQVRDYVSDMGKLPKAFFGDQENLLIAYLAEFDCYSCCPF